MDFGLSFGDMFLDLVWMLFWNLLDFGFRLDMFLDLVWAGFGFVLGSGFSFGYVFGFGLGLFWMCFV